MTRSRMLFVMAVGLSAAACSTTTYTTTQAVAPAGPIVLTSSEQACVDYGFARHGGLRSLRGPRA